MRFRTFCACFALMMYAGTAAAMDSEYDSSFFYDSDEEISSGRMSWSDYIDYRHFRSGYDYLKEHPEISKTILRIKKHPELLDVSYDSDGNPIKTPERLLFEQHPGVAPFLFSPMTMKKDILKIRGRELKIKDVMEIGDRHFALGLSDLKIINRDLLFPNLESLEIDFGLIKNFFSNAGVLFRESRHKLPEDLINEVLSEISGIFKYDKLEEIPSKRDREKVSEIFEHYEKLKKALSEELTIGELSEHLQSWIKKKVGEKEPSDKLKDLPEKEKKLVKKDLLKKHLNQMFDELQKGLETSKRDGLFNELREKLSTKIISKNGERQRGELKDPFRWLSKKLRDRILEAIIEECLRILLSKSPKLNTLGIYNGGKDIVGRLFKSELKGLNGLQELFLCNNGLTELPSKIGKLKNLKRLEIRGNNISELPPEIGELTNLEELKIPDNGLAELPSEIGNLKNLKKLNLNGNKISELPETIRGLKNLESLTITENTISKLPSRIGKLENLRELDLMKNKISELPETIEGLKNLERLKLYKNCISKLPKAIGNLENLKELDLTKNEISGLPETIEGLKNLESLTITKNRISTLPSEIGKLKNLKKLDLSENEISGLPETIGWLENLESLTITKNGILKLPSGIGNLKNLKELNLSKNEISGLPETIGGLKNLESLTITENIVSTLPLGIGKLENLKELNLMKNKISELPETIGGLKNLERLELYENHISELPKTIGKLKKLEELRLSKNKISELPETIGGLENLKTLDLSENDELRELPREIGDLANLTELNLVGNRNLMEKLPEDAINTSSEKVVIDLSGRNLTRVPFDIVNCRKLIEKLDLSNNKLKEFPALMTRLFVRELDLRGNPEIDSIDKVPDLILHVLGLKLIRLTEDGEDKEYDCDKIWKERQLRKRIDDEEASSSQKDEGRNYDEIWKIKQARKEIDDEEASSSQKDEGRNYDEIWKIKQMRKEIDDEEASSSQSERTKKPGWKKGQNKPYRNKKNFGKKKFQGGFSGTKPQVVYENERNFSGKGRQIERKNRESHEAAL